MSVYTINGNNSIELSESHLYGSSRLGVLKAESALNAITQDSISLPGLTSGEIINFTRGKKFFELSNHLGNVLATVTDKKVLTATGDGLIYKYDLLSANEYYPFGMQMPGRNYNAAGYRYGFNGKENDNEVKGEGNQQDYGMRVYDGRLGKFLSVDPLTKGYPWNSTYAFAENDVIRSIDLDGKEKFLVVYDAVTKDVAHVKITRVQNIQKEVIENMQIVFCDMTINDVNQDVLRLQNDGISVSRDSREQSNHPRLSDLERLILRGNVTIEPFKGKQEVVDVDVPKTKDPRGKMIVGEGRTFDSDIYKEVNSEGYISGASFRSVGYSTFEETADKVFASLKKAIGKAEPKAMAISIKTEEKLDQVVKSTFTNLLKKRFGDKVSITWGQYTDDERKQNRKDYPGANANVTIGIIK
jgi:RHS repeat-associated protein